MPVSAVTSPPRTKRGKTIPPFRSMPAHHSRVSKPRKPDGIAKRKTRKYVRLGFHLSGAPGFAPWLLFFLRRCLCFEGLGLLGLGRYLGLFLFGFHIKSPNQSCGMVEVRLR